MCHDHSHRGGSAADELLDWDRRGDDLELEGELDLAWVEPVLRWIGDDFCTRTVGRIVDLGSGPGVATGALAAAFPEADLVAVDGSRPLLDRAAARARRLGVSDRVDTRHRHLGAASIGDLPEADLVWVSRVLHHLPDPAGAVRELRARLRPGGVLVVVEGGLPDRWAPDDLGIGRPGLQARLDVALTEALLALESEHAIRPGIDWAGLLRGAGYRDARTRSWLHDVPAPAPGPVRARVRHGLSTARERFTDALDAEDRTTLDRLLDPADPLGVDRRPDLFWLAAHTVFAGRA